MAKIIAPGDLAELVTGLLLKPQLLGELDSLERYQAFMLDIARVIADHCGGEAVNVMSPDSADEPFLSSEYSSPLVSICPNDNLPSVHNNVWSYYDDVGFSEEEVPDLEPGEAPDSHQIASVRQALQALLANHALAKGAELNFECPMIDWRVPEQTDLDQPGDDRPYKLLLTLGNQSYFDIIEPGRKDEDGVQYNTLSTIIEIDRGVPTLHLATEDKDTALHIRAVDGGLILSPDSPDQSFERVEASRFTYNETRSLCIE